ncbi:hypothetical protein ACIA8O_06270 [Kitasatospora sp. NPDC051853]|uniref:hypothetical protein n=1 Tax=Kitasatospora sp. NPDC051853 TaxID=3364058 RepID=UPI0037A4AE8A
MPHYAGTTEKPVEYLEVRTDWDELVGYLWICDEDGAAGIARYLIADNFDGAMHWFSKLLDARARELSPSEALQELIADPGNRRSGRLVPGSRAVSGLAELEARAAEGYQPPKEPYEPPGRRPDPKFDQPWTEPSLPPGSWVYRYKVDEGHDPAGRVPSHAVAGAWKLTYWGGTRAFWHNPAYGTVPEAVAPSGEASPVPPLRAGRRPAGRALLDWLEDERAPRFCRITGSSGSGRTHLLAWLAASCPPDNPRTGRRVHVVLSAEGLTVRSATWLLAERLGVVARTPDDLMEAVQDGVPRTLVVTDLDRAGGDLLPDMPEQIATELLTPLLQVPWLRVLVEASGAAAAAALSAAAPAGAVLDLDDPRWTEPDRFAAWCAGLAGHPVAADQVHPSPGLALLASRTPPGTPLDPAAPPVERAAALAEAWWAALPEGPRRAVGALAAAGRPVTDAVWAALPGAGGAEAVRLASAYLPPADGPYRRLQPDLLERQVVSGCPPVDHAALQAGIEGGLPRGADGRPLLSGIDPQWLGLLLRHAVHAGVGGRLLADPDVLIHADLATITAAFEHLQPAPPYFNPLFDESAPPASPPPPGAEYLNTALAEAWELAGPVRPAGSTPADRAAALHAWLAGRDQPAADHCAAVSGQRWRAAWSGPFKGWVPAHDPRGEALVLRIAPGRGPLRQYLLAAVNGILRFLDPTTGLDVREVDPSRLFGNGEAGMVCGDEGSQFFLQQDGTVVTYPYPEKKGGRPTPAVKWATWNFTSGVTALATLVGADGPLLAVGDGGGGLGLIRTAAWEKTATDRPLHRGRVTDVDLTEADGGVLLVSGGTDGTVRTWMDGRGPAPEPIDAREHPVTAVAVQDTPHGMMLAAAWSDGLVRLYRWGTDPVALDIRLGLPARSAVIDPDGRVFLALPEGIVALTLD